MDQMAQKIIVRKSYLGSMKSLPKIAIIQLETKKKKILKWIIQKPNYVGTVKTNVG